MVVQWAEPLVASWVGMMAWVTVLTKVAKVYKRGRPLISAHGG